MSSSNNTAITQNDPVLYYSCSINHSNFAIENLFLAFEFRMENRLAFPSQVASIFQWILFVNNSKEFEAICLATGVSPFTTLYNQHSMLFDATRSICHRLMRQSADEASL